MVAKKSASADLERKRFAFFQIGLIVAGACCLVAFEYSTMHTEKKVVQIPEDTEHNWTPVLTEPDDIEEPKTQPQKLAAVYLAPIDTVVISRRAITPGIITTIFDPPIGDPDPDPGYGPIGTPISPGEIIDVPDLDPAYPGGELARMQFIQKMVIYPEIPREMGEQGTVYVEFVVNTDGSICNVLVKNEINKELANEAMRVVKLMPNWVPGEQSGKKVRVRYTIPINFVIK